MIATAPAAAIPLPLRLWRDWLAPRWPMLLLGFALMLAFAGANALYPEIIRRSVDALEAGDAAALGWIAPGIVLVTLLKGATLYAQKVVLNRTLTDVAFAMQRRLFAHLVEADVAALAREPPAALAARFAGDVDTVSLALQRVLNGALRDAMTVVGLFGALLWIDWELTLVAFAVFPLAIWPIVAIGRALRKLTRRASEGVAGMTALIAESLAGVRVAKTYAMEPWLLAKAGATFAAIRDLRRRALQRRAAIDPLMEVLAGVVVAGVIWLIGARIAAGANTLGDITGFVAALLLAAQPLRALGNLNAAVQTGLAGAKRVYDLLDRRAEVIDRPGAPALAVSAGAIALDAVSFAYADGARALDALTLSIPGGARVALVGRSGAGKSTVFNLLPRLYDVTGGAIRIDGQDIRDVSLASLRAAIALVAQEPTLFNDTVRANIALGRPGADAAAIEAAARAAAAHDFIVALPLGYDTPVGERGEALSGGQRQRVAIARAFLRDAPILLLDEATSALDSESETAIRAALDRLARGRTTLVIAHRLATILDADLIAVLDAGRLVELGRHADLLARDGLYASLYRLQFGAAAR